MNGIKQALVNTWNATGFPQMLHFYNWKQAFLDIVKAMGHP